MGGFFGGGGFLGGGGCHLVFRGTEGDHSSFTEYKGRTVEN